MRPSASFKNAARGFTLIEAAIVMGVFAIILAGVWMLVGLVYEKAREHQASLQAITILRNVRQMYSRVGALSGNPSDPYTKKFDEQKIFPPEMKVNPNTIDGIINHPWSTSKGGSVQIIAGYSDSNGEKTQFDLHYLSLPKKACVAMVNNLSGGQVSGLQQIQINSGSCYSADGACTKTLPINLTTAAAECRVDNSATGAGMNDILFRFSLH